MPPRRRDGLTTAPTAAFHPAPARAVRRSASVGIVLMG
ncbi:hypothetical protein MINT15_09810 [Saccharomonospora viridis]|uniref:Uncharacterized protein n=1 Tax=Saccharomonospora viridis TaxID=1852 RepID=A0A837D8C2_9PSEU|nr:hypothetical protein MINT15_09810 [Saccharomonospora viridis]